MTTTDPIRVTHTVASIRGDHGGPSRSVSFLCRALAQQGLNVGLVTTIPQTYEPDAALILPGPEVELRAASLPVGLGDPIATAPLEKAPGVVGVPASGATAGDLPSCDRRGRGLCPAGVRI